MRRDCRRSGARRAARPQPESAASPLLDCAAVRTGPNGGNEMPGFLQTHNITYRRQMQACLHISIRPARHAFAARPALLPSVPPGTFAIRPARRFAIRPALLPSVPPDARLSPAQPRAALLPPIPPCCPSSPARFATQPHAACFATQTHAALLPPVPPSCPSSPTRFAAQPRPARACRPARLAVHPARHALPPSPARRALPPNPARRFCRPAPPGALLPSVPPCCPSSPARFATQPRPARLFARKNAGAKHALLRRGVLSVRYRCQLKFRPRTTGMSFDLYIY